MATCDQPVDKDEWPPSRFAALRKLLLIDSGVLFHDCGPGGRTYRRSAFEEAKIGRFIGAIVPVWLTFSLAVDKSTLTALMAELNKLSKRVDAAVRNFMQATFAHEEVFMGPVTAGDVLMVGFGDIKRYCDKWVAAMKSGVAFSVMFEWGDGFDFLNRWCSTVHIVARPERPSPRKGIPENDFLRDSETHSDSDDASLSQRSTQDMPATPTRSKDPLRRSPRLLTQQRLDEKAKAAAKLEARRQREQKLDEQAKAAAKESATRKGAPGAPDVWRGARDAWWAAKLTTKPGVYRSETLAKATKRGRKGSIRKFDSKAKAEA